MARRLPPNVLMDDLLAAGLCGLVESLRRHDEVVHTDSFESYARIRIRGAVLDELRALDWLPRRLRESTSREESPEAPIAFLSLDDPARELFELSAANEDPCQEVLARLERAALALAIEKLPDRERSIVSMHYFDGVKMKDLSVMLGVSEPRISQLHARALSRLRLLVGSAA